MSASRQLSLAYIFAIFPLTPAFVGFAALRPPGVSLVAVPPALLVLAGALGAAIVLFASRRDLAGAAAFAPVRRGTRWFVCGEAIAAVCGIDPATGFLIVTALAISAIVHGAILRDGESLVLRRRIYGVFLTSATLAAALGLSAWVAGRPAGVMRAVNGRAVGTFVVPGEFAGYLVLAIAVAVGIAVTSRGRLRLVAWSTLACAVPALAATYSRAGWYGCSVAMGLLIVAERPRIRVGFAVAIALAIEAPLLLGYSDHHNPSEEFARLPIWSAAVRAATLFPLTGTGPGAFRRVYADLRPPSELAVAFHPHSAWLGTVTESGMLGVLAVAALLASFVPLFLRRLRTADPARRPVALAIAAGLAGTAVQATVDEIQVLILGCWLPFMALALVEAAPPAATRPAA